MSSIHIHVLLSPQPLSSPPLYCSHFHRRRAVLESAKKLDCNKLITFTKKTNHDVFTNFWVYFLINDQSHFVYIYLSWLSHLWSVTFLKGYQCKLNSNVIDVISVESHPIQIVSCFRMQSASYRMQPASYQQLFVASWWFHLSLNVCFHWTQQILHFFFQKGPLENC